MPLISKEPLLIVFSSDQFSSFDNDNAKEHCIAVKCERGHLKRSSEMCEEHRYSFTCGKQYFVFLSIPYSYGVDFSFHCYQ